MLTRHGLSVNLSWIVGNWCQQVCPWQNLKLNLSNIVTELLYQWLKKYFDNPFKDEHSHLPYGAIDGPPGLSLHIYLSIIQELKDRISNDSWWLIVNNYHQQVLIVINECWWWLMTIDWWQLMTIDDNWRELNDNWWRLIIIYDNWWRLLMRKVDEFGHRLLVLFLLVQLLIWKLIILTDWHTVMAQF